MVQQVRAYGQVLQFPDDMSDDDMAKAIQNNEHVLNPNFKAPEGLSGIAKNVVSGTKQTGRMVGAGFDTIRNELAGVEDYAKASDIARQQETPIEQRKLLGELSSIDRDQGALGQIGDTLSAAGRNPMGTAQMITEQLPNTAVSLGGGYAGFKTGAAAGALFGPVGATIGGTLGFLGGMFLGNVLLETGGKAIEKASDEDGYTPEDRDNALREGAVKGAVITGVDAATLKLGSMVTNRLGAAATNAGAKAEAKVLIEAGVDMSSTSAINAALKSSPELLKSAKVAGEKAAIQALSKSKKVGIIGTGLVLETAGEGIGEYAGEMAATGKGDVVDATIEALSSATQSIAETAYNFNKLKAGNDLSADGMRKVADSVNEMTLKDGINNISKSQYVDEAIQAAVKTVSTKPVTANDVLKTVDPTLLDVERLTGLKPSEVINDLNIQGEQDVQSETSQKAKQKAGQKPVLLGNDTEIVLPDGQSIPAKWAVVDADQVSASIKEGINQPRDRTRAASDIQIQGIANNPDYRRLSDSVLMDTGSPTLSYDGLIVGGNGRFEGISRAHEIGTSEKYRESLLNDALSKGIDVSLIQGIKNPVLVRQITQPFDTRKLAVASNSGTNMQYSGLELAKIDAGRMFGIEDLDIADNGDIAMTGANFQRIKQSLADYNQSEIAAIVDKNGALSQDGVKRIRNAILAKAYGNSETLGRIVESTDGDMRNVLGALTKSAGVVAKARSEISAGAVPKEVDITDNLLDAVETFSQIRAKNQPLENYLAQQNMFGDGIDSDSQEILQFLHDNVRSQKKLTEFIKQVYDQITRIDQTTDNIFGDNSVPSKSEIIKNAKQRTEGQSTEQQQGIFAAKSSEEAGGSDGQESKTQADNAGSGEESQQDSGLNTETSKTVFDSFSALGNETGSAVQAMYDAEQITGLKLGIPIEYAKLGELIPARFDIARKIIEVNTNWFFTKAEGAQFIAEEILHYVDSVSNEKTISASSKLLDWDNGEIINELREHFESKGAYSTFLKYPIDNQEFRSLSIDRKKAEVFARMGVLYFGELDKLSHVLPKTYRAYHGIFKVTRDPVVEEISRKVWSFNPSPYRKVGGEYKSMGASLSSDGSFSGEGNSAELGRLREVIGLSFRAKPSGEKANLSDKSSLETKEAKFSRTAEERLKDRERARQLEKKLNGEGYEFSIEAKDVRMGATQNGRGQEAATAERIAKIFGRRVVWIEASGDFRINGVVVPSIKDTIFIDYRTDKYAHAVIGHELSHHMEHDVPAVYRDMVRALLPMINDIDAYRAKNALGEDMSDANVVREIVGDIMGDNFTDPVFWNKVAESNPSAFKRIADAVISWLKRLATNAKMRGLGSEQWVTDAQKAQDIVAKAVAQYTNQNTSQSNSDQIKFNRSQGWYEFPNAIIAHRSVSDHKDYQAAKDGDFIAAVRLAKDTIPDTYLGDIKQSIGDSNPIVVPVRSAEKSGAANAIPEAVGLQISSKLGIDFDENGIQQMERVGRTGADGWHRIANQPTFEGDVEKGRDYVIVDDTLAQGGTVAQLKEYIESNGGKVSLITALTGKQYSAKIGLSVSTLQLLRDKHGSIESWFKKSFGYGFEGLTESEARFIISAKGLSSEQVRTRIIEAKRDGTDSDVQGNAKSEVKFSRSSQGSLFGNNNNLSSQEELLKQNSARPGDLFASANTYPVQHDAVAAKQKEEQTQESLIPEPTISKQNAPGKIEDFGQKLGNARKDMEAALRKEYTDADIASVPLSKIWPKEEALSLEDPFMAAFAFAAREEIPTKPKLSYKVKSWVEKVKLFRGLTRLNVSGAITKDKILDFSKNYPGLENFFNKVQLLELIENRKDWSRIDSVAIYPDAYKYDASGIKVSLPYSSFKIDGRTTISNVTDIKELAESVNGALSKDAPEKLMQFEIRGRVGNYFINKKGDKEYRPLAKFTDLKEARAYWKDNYDDLVAAWEMVKDTDNVKKSDIRGDENRPRTGKNWRGERSRTRVLHALIEGADVDAKLVSDLLVRHSSVSHQDSGINIPRPFGSSDWPSLPNGMNPKLRERSSYMTVVSINLLRNLSKTESFGVELLGKNNIPLITAVQEAMLTLGHNDKVIRSIVERIPVNVMDFLASKKISAESLFRDKSVLKSFFSIESRVPVGAAIRDNPIVSLIESVALDRTEIISANDPARISLESDTALMTGQFDSGIAKSLFSHDVSPDEFYHEFSFRGVEFGNWVSQGAGNRDRQGMLNQAYDALMDLSGIVGIPPKAVSLNGSLGLAFGSRGKGAALAHFESGNLVINLTKTKGAGNLAHEWFHAMDNYFQRQRGVPTGADHKDYFITYKPEPRMVHVSGRSFMTKEQLGKRRAQNPTSGFFKTENWSPDTSHPQGVRPTVERKFADLVNVLDESPMKERAQTIDKNKEDGYWSRIIERAARSFENYVIAKMMKSGYNNDYLANVTNVIDFRRDPGRYPYLLESEIAPVEEAFDNLFSEIKTKETDKGIAMFSRASIPDTINIHGDDGPKFSFAGKNAQKSILNEDNGIGNADIKTTEGVSPERTNSLDIPRESRFRKFQRKYQDSFNRFTVVKEWLADKGINVSQQADVYAAEERYHAKVANQVEDFREQIRNPLIEKIAKAGFTMDDIADYLEAQHAPEANEAIRKLRDDPEATAYGIADDEAKEYLSKAPGELGKLANELRSITEQTKKLRLDGGLLNKDITDAWEATYKHYIPVKGAEQGNSGTGKGMSVKVKNKRRLGHGRRDEAVIENILQDHERAIMEVEKNRVGKHVVMMAAEIGIPELMTIGQPAKRQMLRNTTAYEVQVKGRTKAVFDTKEGANLFRQSLPLTDKKIALSDVVINPTADQRVVMSASPMLADNEINVYIDGHAIRVQINDELMARAYKKLGIEGYGEIVSAGRMLNSYLSKVYTGYNPEFIMTNMVRDFTTGVINLTGEQGLKMAAKAISNYPKSFATLLRYAATNGKQSTDWIDAYRRNGGNTGAAYLSDMERLGNEVASEYAAYQGVIANLKQGDMANAARAAGRKAYNATLKWIYNLNQAGENAMRLSAFKAMIDSGMNVNDAAKAAKNITVNFNRKGELGVEANAAYLFFNASVQGTAATLHALVKGKNKYQAWALASGLTTLGYLAAASLGGGGEDDYDKIDDYTKERNAVIKYGDGYLKLPIPYGYGFFWNIGRSMADAQRKDELHTMPWHIAASAIEELTPFGSIVVGSDGEFKSDQVLGGALPTVAQIPYQISNNKQLFSGGELMPDSPFDQSQPDREKMWRGTKGTMYDQVSGWLAGAGMDVSPETLKFMTRTATGGAGALVDSSVSAAMLKADGAELDSAEMPFIRKAYKEISIKDTRSAFYKAREEAKLAAEEFNRARRKNDLVAMQTVINDKKEMLALDAYADKLSEVIRYARDQQDAVRLNKDIPIAEKRLKLKELEISEAKFYDKYLDVFNINKIEMKKRSKNDFN